MDILPATDTGLFLSPRENSCKWLTYKAYNFIFHCYGYWEVCNQGASINLSFSDGTLL